MSLNFCNFLDSELHIVQQPGASSVTVGVGAGELLPLWQYSSEYAYSWLEEAVNVQ